MGSEIIFYLKPEKVFTKNKGLFYTKAEEEAQGKKISLDKCVMPMKKQLILMIGRAFVPSRRENQSAFVEKERVRVNEK